MFDPRSFTSGPVGQTKVWVQSVLKARSTTLSHYRRGYPFFGYNDVQHGFREPR
jgi:hypothetical protein